MRSLSATMKELLAAMRKGVALHWISGIDAYYYRTDTHRTVTRTVEALIERGYVIEKIDRLGHREAALAPWTPKQLEEFDELTTMLSSQHQMTRHEGRFAIKKFEAKHGTELCQKMFDYLVARDKKRGLSDDA